MSTERTQRTSQRKGAALTYMSLIMLTLLGFGAMAVDLGFKFVVRTDLQNAAEASALAAAGALALDDGSAGHLQRGTNAAVLYASKHTSVGLNNQGLVLNEADVVFGDAVYNTSTRRWGFSTPSTTNTPYGVQVTVRRDGTSNPQVPYFFGRIWNLTSGTQIATSTAMVAPRDIALVLDLSGSMIFDSLLDFRNNVQVNLRDIWVCLESVAGSPNIRTIAGVGDFPTNYELRSEAASAYAGQDGRTFASMAIWGTAIGINTYNQTAVTNDLGMYNLPPGQAWNTAATLGTGAASPKYAWLVTNTANPYALVNRNTAAEINRILVPIDGGSESTTLHRNRVQVILGFSNWTDTNANGRLDTAELTVAVDEPYNLGAGWNEWINYVRGGYGGSSYFQHRYGLKSYVNWLLDACFAKTPGIAGSTGYTPRLQFTPVTKLQACKDAILGLALALKGASNEDESSDRVGLVVFGTDSSIDPYTVTNGLTSNFDRIADLPYPHQAGEIAGNTNSPEALLRAFIMLQGPGSRPFAQKMIVLLTDGLPTIWNHYTIVNPNNPANRPQLNAVTTVAQLQSLFGGFPSTNKTATGSSSQTETLNVTNILTSGYLGLGAAEILAVGVGSDANAAFLNQVAAYSDGAAYMALHDINNPNALAAILQQIFQKVAFQRPIALIK